MIQVVENAQFFKNQLAALCHLEHPNIIKIYDYFEEENLNFVVTEFCTKGTLERYIKDKTSLSSQMKQNFVSQLLDAVNYLHSNQFVHLDIRPGTILIDDYDRIKLCGFEYSGSYPTGVANEYTAHESIWSPEMVDNHPYDPFKADSWQVGLTIFFIMCGYMPPINSGKRDRFTIPSTLPDNIKEILKGALNEDPAVRASVADMFAVMKPKLQRIQSEKKPQKAGANPYRLSIPLHAGVSTNSLVYRCSLPATSRPSQFRLQK